MTASTTQGAEVAVRVVEETDSYTASVKGAVVEAIRVGRGTGPNRVVGIPGERLTVTRSTIGFPMHSYSYIPDDRVIVAYLSDVPCESQWCGLTLRPGNAIVYGPGVTHVASNRPGLSFTFVVTELDRLQALGQRLGEPLEPPAHGSARELVQSAATADLGATLGAYVSAAVDGRTLKPLDDAVLRAVVSLLASPHAGRPIGLTRGIDSRMIVRDCLDYAEAIGRIPAVSELCLAAHVSQRRLRAAFAEEFDQPPSRFFRNWALERARRHLIEAGPAERTVTEVATGLGFDHLSRFASHYRRMFEETPSVTLRAQTNS